MPTKTYISYKKDTKKLSRNYRNYSKEELEQAIKDSLSIRSVLLKIGLAPQGGSYQTIKRFIKFNNIDTSHFTGQLWSKGKTLGPSKPLEYYFSNKAIIASHKLKLRLFKDGLKEPKCEVCGWNEINPFTGNYVLELDHINGIHDDNQLENLRILCPNHHALTPNYRGRAKKIKKPALKSRT